MARGRPRQFDPDKALDAAMLLFWRHGYDGTSMSALTRAMGINTPSLYAAFGSKERLFRRALDRYVERPASYLPKALSAPTARETAEQLFAGAIHMVMQRRQPDGCLLVQGALTTAPVSGWARRELSRRRASAEALVRQRFERAMHEGDLRRGTDAAKLAKYIVTVLWGMSVQAAGGATREDLENVARMAMKSWPE
jgi:AcrR family transcriptional regulator